MPDTHRDDHVHEIARLRRANRRLLWCGVAAVAAGVLAGGAAGRAVPQEPAEPKALGRPPASVETAGIDTFYANYCRVTGTQEELVFDFGLNTQAAARAGEPVRLTHRLVMSFYTAKRLLLALEVAIKQYEETYGPLELDARKRAKKSRPASPDGK